MPILFGGAEPFVQLIKQGPSVPNTENFLKTSLAQLVEHQLSEREVMDSNPGHKGVKIE